MLGFTYNTAREKYQGYKKSPRISLSREQGEKEKNKVFRIRHTSTFSFLCLHLFWFNTYMKAIVTRNVQ